MPKVPSLARTFAFALGIGLLFVPSVQSSGDDEVVSDEPYLNIPLPSRNGPIGEWAWGTATGQVADQLNERVDGWVVQIPVTADDVFGTMYNGIDGLARNLVADTARQTIGNARDGLMLVQDASYTLDKTRLLDLTLNSLAQTSEAMLDFSSIAAFANMEIRAGVGTDQRPGYSLLTVQPLYEAEDSRHNVFAQGGLDYDYRTKNQYSRTTVNLGLGYRYLTPDEKWLYGTNIFYDHEFPFNHQRLGFGAEIESSLYRMGSNYYQGLSDWKKTGKGFSDGDRGHGFSDSNIEKPLDGMDLEIAGRLPFFPELELAVRGTRWFALTGLNDIHELALRGDYTPVPAVSVRVEARDDNVSEKPTGEATVGLKLNLGAPLADQLKPEKEEALLSVKARRFHVVERQNIIKVLEFSVVPHMTAVYAKGKSFVQGCGTAAPAVNIDPFCDIDEQLERTVTFAHDFEMGTYEVTWDEYNKCIDDGACIQPIENYGGVPTIRYGTGTYPANYNSLNYINHQYLPWLNAKTGRDYRLPTESEWEYVARAGTHTIYPWGDNIREGGVAHANCKESSGHCEDGYVKTSPVGSFPPNAWGFYDMTGNVWEAVQDTWLGAFNLPADYPTDGSAYTKTDYLNPNTPGSVGYIKRSGSYRSRREVSRSAERGRSTTITTGQETGFRLARTL